MIICKSLNFAFFRAPKTGSTTTTFLLRLGRVWPEDAIMSYTPYGDFPEQNFISPITFMRDPLTWKPELDPNGNPITDQGIVYEYPYFAHTTPQQMVDKGIITIDELKSMNAYSFVRNPIDRMLSAAVHVVGRHATPRTILAMLDKQFPTKLHPKKRRTMGMTSIPQADYLYVNGEMVIKPILSTPFRDAVDTLCDASGIPRYAHMPRLNNRPAWKDDFEKQDFWNDEIVARYKESNAEDWRVWEELSTTGAVTPNPDYVVSDPVIHTRGLGPRGFAHIHEERVAKALHEESMRRGETPSRRRAG